MLKNLVDHLNKYDKILILGFGAEGKSTYQFVRQHFPTKTLGIADKNQINLNENPPLGSDKNILFYTGENYLEAINFFDLVIKSPGISFKNIEVSTIKDKITSQTDLFLRFFSKQTIGITGTKGKSTTTSLIYHIFQIAGKEVIIAGNIGKPLFETIMDINPSTIIVAELSSHQLEFINKSPHVGILLNIFEEHLDHYKGFKEYATAKFNIALYQQNEDIFIYHHNDQNICKLISTYKPEGKLIPFSLHNYVRNGIYTNNEIILSSIDGTETELSSKNFRSLLVGEHNLLNILAVMAVCKVFSIPTQAITEGIDTFKPLPHRLEFVGKYNNINFYNDSISTIPEATIAAIKSLKEVDTIILGGFDRGIEYGKLAKYLDKSDISNILMLGEAGKRISSLMSRKEGIFLVSNLKDAVDMAFVKTKPAKICLLSPAASSYDMFKNFEHRGDMFKQLVNSRSIL